MDILIFGFFELIARIIFISILLIPVFIVYYIGKKIHIPYIRWFLLVLVITVPVAWAVASYTTYKQGCKSVTQITFYSSPQVKVDGFLLKGHHVSSNVLIERGAFQFIEVPLNDISIRRYSAGEKENEWSPIPINSEFVEPALSKSKFIVTETPGKRIEYWWKPPIYTYSLEVREKVSGKLLAKATDLVFGGDITGTFMRFFKGDQDFKYLSCGYASANIDAWRPTLASRPRTKQYEEADLNFLVKALSQPPSD